MYRHNDRYLGELLELLDKDTVVLIVSDHGFQAGGKLPSAASGKRVSGATTSRW